MKVNLYMQKAPVFKGVREDRNAVSQLSTNNNYSLTEPNQRRINKAIDALAKQRGEDNIKFLLDVGSNLKYQTNIVSKDIKIKNDWASKLKGATEESLAHSNPILRDKYQKKIDETFAQKPLTKDEEFLTKTKTSLVRKVKGYKDEDKIKKDLDYFIASTETPIEQKKYVMKRLAYFMSPKYKINPQLQDKKPQILSEIANDIALNTHDKDIPNTKAVNQKTHGMCAAISIVRKAVAYEDKPNFVDAVLSELDDSPVMKVYDKQNLGSGKRVPVNKTYIDYDYAQERGYRIIDASTLQWMNIGGMYGVQSENLQDFNAFDKNNFDAFHDSFFVKSIPDKKLANKQLYFQTLTKAEEDIRGLKSAEIRADVSKLREKSEINHRISELADENKSLRTFVKRVVPKSDNKTQMTICSDLMSLSQTYSDDIVKLPKQLQKYAFIPNEEDSQKQKKVEAYIKENYLEDKIDEDALKSVSSNIVVSIEDLKSIEKDIHNRKSASGKVARARRFYEAEAAYRASVVIGLMESDNAKDRMIQYNIPDRESRISKGYADVIERIEKKNDKKLLEHFAPYFETTPDDKEGILNGLIETKRVLDYMLTEGLDECYRKLGFGSRNEVLVQDISSAMEDIQKGDKEELDRVVTTLKIDPKTKDKKSEALKQLEALKNGLESEPQNEKLYIEAFNKMGYKDQIDAYIDIFNQFQEGMDEDSELRDVFAANFKEANNLTDDVSDKDVLLTIQLIGGNFNHISQSVAKAASFLEVPGDDGIPYNTVNTTNIVLKNMEKNGTLVPCKVMDKLQNRFAKIDKLRSSDEFASRHGKISDPSLYKFSKEESDAIKSIDKKLNKMYAEVKRERFYQYKEIKDALEKHAQYIGTNSGNYWVYREGHSGLYSAQEVKIFEQLTDRPHKIVEDIEEGVDIIKNTPHSGISGSSVFHDKMGGHAMYVADIVKDEKTGKDILFHDNSWGASEHENIWIDSEGKMRTDYSDNRGGELGYITNEDWKNGNYVNNLIYKKGHISPEDVESKLYNKLNPGANSEGDFQLMNDFILEGKSTDYRDIAASIKDEIFIPDAKYISTLEKHAKSMTKEEIKKAIFRSHSLYQGYKSNFDKIIKRITPTKFNKGITTEEEYNALSDNDPIKLAFEKAAVRESFEDASMYKELGKARTMDAVKKAKEKQRKLAKEDFYYTFGKNSSEDNVFISMDIASNQDLENSLIPPAKKYKLKATINDMAEVLKDGLELTKEEKQEADGSLAKSIDIMVNRLAKQYDEVIKPQENKEAAKEEFIKNLRETFEKDLYFNKDDLKIDTPKQKGIRMWIDDTFKPKTDEEFVRIFRMLQDMPKSEFENYTINLDDKYLGMKEVKGFDILKKVLNANDDAESSVRNVVFFDEYSDTLEQTPTRKSYKYKKLERNSRSAIYTGTRTFDDLYRTFDFALQSLDYERIFNKYKGQGFMRYGAFPSYPKIDLGDDPVMNGKIEQTAEIINTTLNTISNYKNCIYNIKLKHLMDDYRHSIPEGRPLNEIERKVLYGMAGDFITANLMDKDLEDARESAFKVLDLGKDATIKDYNEHFDKITHTVQLMEDVNSPEEFKKGYIDGSHHLKKYFKKLLDFNIAPRYQRILNDDLKNLTELGIVSRNQSNGMDSNRDLLELQLKISENSDSTDKKGMIEGFVKIKDALDKAKYDNLNEGKEREKLAIQIFQLHKLSDEYLNKYVDKSAIPTLRGNFNDWYRTELVGGKKQKVEEFQEQKAYEKFAADFKKYHLTSTPSEVLENFLMKSAKDAEGEDNSSYKQYLETELNLAKLIAVQEALMEAVDKGNAAHVKEYFDEFDVSYNGAPNGDSMASDGALDCMVRSIILNDNFETAKMFVEKLGLGERVLKIERDVIKQVNPKEKIDNVATILRTVGRLTNTTVDVYSKLIKKIDDIEDINEVDKEIIKTKAELAKALKFSKEQKIKQELLKPLDEMQEFVKEKPNATRSSVLASKLNDGVNEVNDIYNKRLQKQQEFLNAVYLIYKFLGMIQLPEYSKGIKLQQKILQEQHELEVYNNKVLQAAAAESPSATVRMSPI